MLASLVAISLGLILHMLWFMAGYGDPFCLLADA